MLLRRERSGPRLTTERKGPTLEESIRGRMRYSATLAVHVLSLETRGNSEDGESLVEPDDSTERNFPKRAFLTRQR